MKHIMITGASSGIGAATCRYFDREGYRVILVARNEERMKAIAETMKAESIVLPADLTKQEQIDRIFQTCREQGILLDGLVHCAGVGYAMPIKAIRIEEDIHRQMEINAYSFAALGKYFSSKRYSRDGSAMVAISSMAAKSCISGHCGYASSKAALNAIVEVLAKELVRRKIRVNAILPTYVDTELLKGNLEETFHLEQKISEIQPFGVIEPEAVSALAEFLISEKGKYITGALIPMTGGAL